MAMLISGKDTDNRVVFSLQAYMRGWFFRLMPENDQTGWANENKADDSISSMLLRESPWLVVLLRSGA